MIRHGDILLRPVPAFDHCGRKWLVGTNITLALGEATGHAHLLTADEPGTLISSTSGGRTLLRVLADAHLTHEEHAQLHVAPGWYEVLRQRVYTPAAPRWVQD